MFEKRTVIIAAIGIALGALGGFLYWKYVGCISGTCAIWSNPGRATLYGALMGGLLFMAFTPERKSQ